MAQGKPFSILFVCLGNICRSPLAEGIFRARVEEAGFSGHFLIESCGTGNWHIGEKAHQDTRRTARENGIDLEGHRARQLRVADLKKFHRLVAMDSANWNDILRLGSLEDDRLCLLRDFDPEPGDGDVPDPYYMPEGGFELVYEVIDRSTEKMLNHFIKKLKLR